MDADLEQKVKECSKCQLNQKLPPTAPLHPWDWPERPWARIHADYAGPFMGKMFLLMVDAHSKWLEVHIVNKATSQSTIEKMRATFATHGLPEMLVTDNGTAFTSSEFEAFLQKNGIRHVKSAPYHPATNGLAERAVQTFKAAMKKASPDTLIETKVSRFLFHYRLTPHSTTGIPPAELLFGRRPRSHLDLLHPSLASHVQSKQEQQKQAHDGQRQQRKFKNGDDVLVRNFQGSQKWLPGSVIQVRGPLTLDIQLEDGRIVRKHLDHVISRSKPQAPQCTPVVTETTMEQNQANDDIIPITNPQDELVEPISETSPNPSRSNDDEQQPSMSNNPTSIETPNDPEIANEEPPPTLRRSNRQRRPPDRYQIWT